MVQLDLTVLKHLSLTMAVMYLFNTKIDRSNACIESFQRCLAVNMIA